MAQLSSVQFPSMELIKKYDRRGSFYTDYPALGLWEERFTSDDYERSFAELAAAGPERPLFFYVHYPYCPKQCMYCMCFSEISQSKEKNAHFLSYTSREVDLMLKTFAKLSFTPNIKKIHFGGGSPSYLDQAEFDQLLAQLKRLIDFSKVEEIAIEVDPRTVTAEKMLYYADRGINRISLGVQEFDLAVQKAINRVQPVEMIEGIMTPEVRRHFKSYNFDIIYGLPRQTRESFKKTMDEVRRLRPDRMGVCILGWRPDIFKHQRVIKESELPSLEDGNLMNFDAIEALVADGYERIGIDHYALPTEDLAVAARTRTLHRSAMGYNPGECIDSIGIGPSGMNRVLNYYFQRPYKVSDYFAAIDQDKFPILRGYALTRDMEIRRQVMEDIICYSKIDFPIIEQAWNIRFREYFAEDLAQLAELEGDGIVTIEDQAVKVTEVGRFFHRHVCQAFDILLRQGGSYKHARDTA